MPGQSHELIHIFGAVGGMIYFNPIKTVKDPFGYGIKVIVLTGMSQYRHPSGSFHGPDGFNGIGIADGDIG